MTNVKLLLFIIKVVVKLKFWSKDLVHRKRPFFSHRATKYFLCLFYIITLKQNLTLRNCYLVKMYKKKKNITNIKKETKHSMKLFL